MIASTKLRLPPHRAEENFCDLLSSLYQVAALRHHNDVALRVRKLCMFHRIIDGEVGRRREDTARFQNIALLKVISFRMRVPWISLFSIGHRLRWPTDPLPEGVYRGLRTAV